MTHDAAARAAAILNTHLSDHDSSVVAVSRSRLAANVAAVRRTLGSRRLWAVVKADAYGLGAVAVARTLCAAGADALAVARIEEVRVLRAAGITAPILLLGPLPRTVPDDPGLHVSLTCPDDLERAAALPPAVRVHVKIDTGMGRLGLAHDPDRWLPQARGLGARWVGLWSHYANADTPNDSHNDVQQARFWAALDAVSSAGVALEHVHLANSAGLLRLHAGETGARVGLYLYGGDPWATPTTLPPPLSVAEWVAPLRAVRTVPAAWPLSYRGHFVTAGPTQTAVLPVGYADGIPTHSRTPHVWTSAGRRALRGRVTMDLSMIELTGNEGSAAYVLGPHDVPDGVTIGEWAVWTGRIPYEVLTAIGPRVKRVMVE